ncbi:MAG: hypothetical protein ACE5RN_00935 [Nitrosopumilaceae archaeon]
MPLTNNVIIKLNEITTRVTEKNSLTTQDELIIKEIFNGLLKSGENYNVDEIEYWFKNEGTWKNKKSIIRITNMSHYIQEKFQQNNKFQILSNNESCDCD